MAHEGVPAQAAFLHLGQLVFPLAGEGGGGQFLDAQTPQQGDEGEGLGGGHQFLALPVHVILGDQVLDDLGSGGRRAQATASHGSTHLLVLHHLARAFHGAEQGGLGEAGRRSGLGRLDRNCLGGQGLAGH